MYILQIQIMGFNNTKVVYFLEVKLLRTIYINKTKIIQSMEISDPFQCLC